MYPFLASSTLDQTYMKQCREMIAGVFLCCVARTDVKYVASQRSNGRQWLGKCRLFLSRKRIQRLQPTAASAEQQKHTCTHARMHTHTHVVALCPDYPNEPVPEK